MVLKNAPVDLLKQENALALKLNPVSRPITIHNTNIQYDVGDYKIRVSKEGLVHIEVPTSDATIDFDIPLSTLIMKMSAKTQTTAGLKPKVSINRNLYMAMRSLLTYPMIRYLRLELLINRMLST